MQKTKAWMDAQPMELLEAGMPGSDPEAKAKLVEAYTAHYENDLKELLTKSFDRHDTKKTQALDKEDTEVSFGNLIRVLVTTFCNNQKQWAPMLADMLPG